MPSKRIWPLDVLSAASEVLLEVAGKDTAVIAEDEGVTTRLPKCAEAR